jgi:toxin ParE1/3/4
VQLVIHPDAQVEIVEAADWYDQRAEGLGNNLMTELEGAFQAIVERPGVWPIWPGTARATPPIQRYLLSRFRYYAVALQHLDDHILILAVVHLRRKPFFWIARTGNGE